MIEDIKKNILLKVTKEETIHGVQHKLIVEFSMESAVIHNDFIEGFIDAVTKKRDNNDA